MAYTFLRFAVLNKDKDKIPPRPRWNHKSVKEAVATKIVSHVIAWAERTKGADNAASPQEFQVAVALAMLESPDGYQCGRYLEDMYEWRVDYELVQIFAAAFRELPSEARRQTIEWVMKHAARFPGKRGDVVFCRIGDAEVIGTVEDTIPTEASAVIKVRGKDARLIVNAEEVLRVTNPIKPKPPNRAA